MVEKAAANVRPRPASWPVENSKAHVKDEVEELIMFGPECSAGGRACALLQATGSGDDRSLYATQDLPESPPPEKLDPMPKLLPDAPGRHED